MSSKKRKHESKENKEDGNVDVKEKVNSSKKDKKKEKEVTDENPTVSEEITQNEKPPMSEKKRLKNLRRKERKKAAKLEQENPSSKNEENTTESVKNKPKKRKQDFKEKKEPKKQKKNENKQKKKENKEEYFKLVEYNKKISELGAQKKLGSALETYDELLSQNLKPSVYTFTNLINACVRGGELEKAKQFFKEMQERSIQPNEVTYTAILKGYCQEGQMDEAMSIFKDLETAKVTPNLRTFNTLLRGCSRCGDLQKTDIILENMKKYRIEPDSSSFECIIKAVCQASDLERGWKIVNEMESKNTVHSQVYSALAIACAVMGDFAGAKKAIEKAENSLGEMSKNYEKSKERASLKQYLQVITQEIQRDVSKVQEYIQLVESKREKPTINQFLTSNRFYVLPSQKVKRLDFAEIFGNSNTVKMEVCSGSGDWVVDKASKNPNQNWVAIEIRQERCYQIWSQSIMKKLKNILVLCGDGHVILEDHISSDSIEEVFINFPEPPVWAESSIKLVRPDFLEEVHRVLKPNSAITVVTDNGNYADSMAQEFYKLVPRNKFKSAFAQHLSTKLPDGYGTSFFDRLWNAGNKQRRYFLKFVKNAIKS